MKIMLRGLFADKPTLRKFLIVVFLVAFSTLTFSLFAGLLTDLIYGVDPIGNPAAFSDINQPGVIMAAKFFQLLSTGIGMFLLPSLLLALLFSKYQGEYLPIKAKITFTQAILTIFVMIAAVPVINVLLVWNQEMQLPSFLSGIESWMKDSEEQLAQLTDAFLRMDDYPDLFYNLLIIAVLPALGEEFLFRGIIQKLFTSLTRNVHWAILLSAVIFSAIHMQFYGFIPRMMLGVLFGYLLVWTGSMWAPVVAHFINNSGAVILSFISQRYKLPFDQDTIGTTRDDLFMALFALLFLSIAIYLIYRTSTGMKRNSQ